MIHPEGVRRDKRKEVEIFLSGFRINKVGPLTLMKVNDHIEAVHQDVLAEGRHHFVR